MNSLEGKEIDIYLPQIAVGIEYNGSWCHASENGVYDDKDKYYQSKKFKIEQANFTKTYMSLLNKNSLDTFIEGKNFDNNNKILYNSYKSKLENLSEDKLLYSNQQFLLNINNLIII